MSRWIHYPDNLYQVQYDNPALQRQPQFISVTANDSFRSSNLQFVCEESWRQNQQSGQFAVTPNTSQFSRQTNNGRQPQHLQMPGFHEAQNFASLDQLMPIDKILIEASQVFTSPAVDWVTPAFQQIQLMKERYLPTVITIYDRVWKQKLMATNNETAIRFEKYISVLEKMYKFLNQSPQELQFCGKEKAYRGMDYLIRSFGQCRTRDSPAVHQFLPVENVSNQYQAPQMEQVGNFGKFSNASLCINDFLLPGRQKMETSRCSGSSQFSPGISGQTKKQVESASEAEILSGSLMGFHQRSFSSDSAVAQASVSASSSPCKPMDQAVNRLEKKQMQQKRNEDTNVKCFGRINQKWTAIPASRSSSCTLSAQSSQPLDSPSKTSRMAKTSSTAKTSRMATTSSTAKTSRTAKESSLASVPTSIITLQEANQCEVIADAKGLLRKTCLPADLTSPVEKEPPLAKEEDPLKRLMDMVKSMSPTTLKSAVLDMEAVTRDIDYMQSRKKRKLDNMSSNYSTICLGDGTKRLKKETQCSLFKDFEEIRQKLEISLEVISMKEEFTSTMPEVGILVRCLYIPVGFPDSSKQMFPRLSVDMMVSTDYPNSSPTILERMPPVCREDDKEGIYLWERTMSKLSSSLGKYSQPVSVRNVAEAWNDCARETFLEFAEQRGGGSFSSRYGKWDYCVAV